MFDIKPIEKTQEEIATDELIFIASLSTNGIKSLELSIKNTYNAFWNGTVSPVIKAKIMGTQLADMFTKSAQTNAFIKSMDDSWEVQTIPEGVDIAWNNDGSGIITDNR